MPQTAPFHMIGGPIDVWTAPYGTAFTDISVTPSGSWVLLGSNGNKDYREDGVTMRFGQEVEVDEWRTLGVTLPRKASRVSETIEIEFDLTDLHMSYWAKAMNLDLHTVTTTAAGSGAGGNKNIDLERGLRVGQCALIIRGSDSPEASAISDSFNLQVEIRNAIQIGESELVWKKDGPAFHHFLFTALWDPSGTGKIRSQHAAAA